MVFSVTSSIFYKKLCETCQAVRFPQSFRDGPIMDTQVWVDGMEPKENYMYLLTAEDLLQNRRRFHGCLLICAGSYDLKKAAPDTDNDLIICPGIHDIRLLVNMIFTIMNQFRNWRNTLNSILLTTESFGELFMASMEFLLVNTSYEVMAVSDHFFGHFAGDPAAKARAFADELQTDEEHILAGHFGDEEPYSLSADDPDVRLYAANIFYHDTHTATLIAKWPAKDYEKGELQFLAYTASMITSYYLSYYSRIHHTASANRLIGLLLSAARGELPSASQVPEILFAYGWLATHTYLVIEFSFLRQREIGFSTDYFCAQIEETFRNCVAFTDDDTVYCVLNTSLTSESGFLEQFPYFLRDNLCIAGIGNPCSDFYSLHTCFSQARQALLLGRQNDPHFWYYRFSDYTFQYLMMQNAREYAPSQIIHPALATLEQHDALKGTEYYRTLKAYLENNMNASRTAESLYIHRSTFLQRLEMIERLTKIDLKDMQERTYLQLSYLMAEEK